MIYVTGDLHGDLKRFKQRKIKRLKKDDTLIVCGDCGFVYAEDKQEEKALKWLSKRKYNVLFVDGAHDKTELLEKYEFCDFAGSKARRINERVYMLLRGTVYTIEDKRIFAFGSGLSESYNIISDIISSDAGSLPTTEETQNGIENLASVDNQIDYIVTYDAPVSAKTYIGEANHNGLNTYFEEIYKLANFKCWYFGRYHKDKAVTRLFKAVYEDVLPVYEAPKKKRG